MLEILIELDYQAIRQALMAAYLLSMVFPLAAFFFVSGQNNAFKENNVENLAGKLSGHQPVSRHVFDRRGMQRFFTLFRIKQTPGDPDDIPFLLTH
ncbi:hypothetical protein [Bacillus massiliglaciei]|uniref:hypothetical protein n=1 Tax=Bacillus massiliglaciei TaxID=1816693 RepID=UPI000DA6182C|nr:hypothetical protein [Bacillus massiliglaciei]